MSPKLVHKVKQKPMCTGFIPFTRILCTAIKIPVYPESAHPQQNTCNDTKLLGNKQHTYQILCVGNF